MKKFWRASAFLGLICILALVVAQAAGPAPGSADEAGWAEVLKIAGAKLPADKDLASLLGPLPGATALAGSHALSPSAFAAQYRSADSRTQLLMARFARARLRELGRRGVIKDEAVAAVLGPEPDGVPGSRLFGIVPVPGEAYHALINYLEFTASRVPGGEYQPSADNREKIDRALQDSLALSSADGRLQYRDFDVVWSWIEMRKECGQAGDMGPGLFWLYDQVRGPAGLTFLPALPPDLAARVDQESGKLFGEARAASADMPDSLAALTQWRCGE